MSSDRQHLEDLRAASDVLPNALVLLLPDGRIDWLNLAAQRLLGLERPADIGRLIGDCLHHGELGAWLRNGADQRLNDLPSPVDPQIQLQVDLIPFANKKQLLMARDTSKLSRLEQTRSNFVANVSHELRTPLTVIHGYLEMLDPEDVPRLAPVLHEMRAQSRRMGQIVEDLLTLTRLETQEDLEDERVGMGAMLYSLLKEGEALSHGRHKITVGSDLGADLLGSPRDLHSAFSNLVSNAVRYTPTDGTIHIQWQRTSRGGEFSVSDSGYGIPAAHLARLTERFYRVSSSRSRETGGTGLGLSIVKHVLNLHDAQMHIESEPGKGSTFTCIFDASRLLEPGTETRQKQF